MRKLFLTILFVTKVMTVYSQIQVGLELGVNSVYNKRIQNEYFEVSNKWNYSLPNIGFYASLNNGNNQISLRYRYVVVSGAHSINQFSTPNLSNNIIYEYDFNSFSICYLYKWKSLRFGANLTSYHYSNLGFGVQGLFRGTVNNQWNLTTDFHEPKKWVLAPVLELAYEFMIRKKLDLTVSLEIPIRRFLGYSLNYESIVNSNQTQQINITPDFYLALINVRVPIFSIGKEWNYFSKNTNQKRNGRPTNNCPVN